MCPERVVDLLPHRLNKVSSTATTIGASASSSLVTISRAAIRHKASISHTAEEKNRHAAWKEIFEAIPAPASTPTTLRRPACSTSPVASTVNKVKVPRQTAHNTVDAARLTCGRVPDQHPFPQVTAKCEDLSGPVLTCEYVRTGRCWGRAEHGSKSPEMV
jgi:hypothetical protein